MPSLVRTHSARSALSFALVLAAVAAALPARGDHEAPALEEEGFVSLFNGRDLSGWGYRPTSDADKEAARKWRA